MSRTLTKVEQRVRRLRPACAEIEEAWCYVMEGGAVEVYGVIDGRSGLLFRIPPRTIRAASTMLAPAKERE